MEDSTLLPPLMKNKSKFVIGDETKTAGTTSPPPAGIISNTNSATAATNTGGGRRPALHRHHVKRRSLGHARIRPLSGKHYAHNNSLTDTEIDEDEDEDSGRRSAPLRRSQSQRSLRRMDMLQPMIPLAQPKSPTPPPLVAEVAMPLVVVAVSSSHASLHGDLSGSNSRVSSTSNPSLRLSTTPSTIAEPIEQPLNAVADNLIGPEIQGAAYTAAQEVIIMSSSSSRFTAVATPTSLSNAPAVSRNALRSQFLTRRYDHPASAPAELVDREYTYVREHQNPMTESMIRCVLKKPRIPASRTLSTSAILKAPPQPHQPLTMALQRRRQQQHQQERKSALSSSSPSSPLIQHQQLHYTTTARPPSSNPVNSNGNLGSRWGAAAGSLWDRMMHGL